MTVRGWCVATVAFASGCGPPQARQSDGPPVAVAAPSATAEPTATPTPQAVVTVAALQAIAPELTAPCAARLIEVFGRAGQPAEAVAEAGLATASQGFRNLEEGAVRDVGALLDAAYATLASEDRARLGAYLDRVRSGGTSPDEAREGHRLFARAVRSLDDGRRSRLQALFEKGVFAGLRYEAEARARTLAAQPAPVLEPMSSLVPGPHRVVIPRGAVRTPAPMPVEAGAPRGRGEAYWRAEAERRRRRVETLESELAEAERIGASYIYPPDGTGQTGFGAPTPDPFYVNRAKINARIAQLRSQLAAAKKSLSDLDDDARRDYAMPGWLR